MEDQVKLMDSSENVKDYCGQCRETAVGILLRRAGQLRAQLAGLDALVKIVEGLPVDSPAEVMLWEILQNQRHGCPC